jgi:hypothetical protein
MEVAPKSMREIHLHPNADEWQYYLSGTGRMTAFASQDSSRTFDVRAGDVGYVPKSMSQYVQNTGDVPLKFLELFRSPRFEDVSLNQWLALTPAQLVKSHLGVDQSTIDHLSKNKVDRLRAFASASVLFAEQPVDACLARVADDTATRSSANRDQSAVHIAEVSGSIVRLYSARCFSLVSIVPSKLVHRCRQHCLGVQKCETITLSDLDRH